MTGARSSLRRGSFARLRRGTGHPALPSPGVTAHTHATKFEVGYLVLTYNAR